MIAIVDDDEAVCQATGSLLRSLGYRVATFLTAEEFLNSGQLREISCLITDVQMPGMSGIELQARLKAEGHPFPVIVITAFPDDAYVIAPFSKAHLLPDQAVQPRDVDCLPRPRAEV